MADGALMTIDEYLHTSFRPDCDFVDGEVQERLWGEFDHGRAMAEILFYLVDRYPGLRRRVLPSLRVRVRATCVRVPDICVLAEDAPEEQVPTLPPILCIEILSPEDGMMRFMAKLKDFADMGCAHLLDHRSRRGPRVDRNIRDHNRSRRRYSAGRRSRNAADRNSGIAPVLCSQAGSS